MQKYVAFLRGINVGGNALIKMADLKIALSQSGLNNVRTYIQSGNVIFESSENDKYLLADHISEVIQSIFNLPVKTVVFTGDAWRLAIEAAPDWWGKDPSWKHNALILTEPMGPDDIRQAIGELKLTIENIAPGNGVVYQSVSFSDFGKATTGKLASKPIYQKMTVRNYNTATKLAALLA